MEQGRHTLGWQDEGLASVVMCGTTEIRNGDFVLSTDREDAQVCPVCGKQLRLIWHVYVEVVADTSADTNENGPTHD